MQNHDLKPQAPQGSLEGGRLTEKNAWSYHKELCEYKSRVHVDLRLFKLLVEQGKIPSKKVKNPFGAPPEFTQGIWAGDIEAFVSTLAPLQEETALKKDDDEIIFTEEEALAFLQERTGKNISTPRFRAYLDYFVVKAEWVEDGYLVEKAALDDFLKKAPDGDHAARFEYRRAKQRGDMSVTRAYEKYADLDPNPIKKHEFNYLAHIGVIPTVCRKNSSDVSFCIPEQGLSVFLALRQRHYDMRSWETMLPPEPSMTTFDHTENISEMISSYGSEDNKKPEAPPEVTLKPILDADIDSLLEGLDMSDMVMDDEDDLVYFADDSAELSVHEEVLTVADGYGLYKTLVKDPLTYSWFRDRCGDPEDPDYPREVYFPVVESYDDTTKSRWKIRASDIRAYVASNPDDKPRNTRRSCKGENAYEKYKDVIPDQVTQKLFDSLVRGGSFEMTGRDNNYLSEDSVRKFFESLCRTKKGHLPSPEAYALYLMGASDPMSFTYFVDQAHQGLFDSRTMKSYKDDRLRYVPAEGVLRFLKQHPSGRRRPSRTSTPKNKTVSTPILEPEVPPTPIPDTSPAERGAVTLFMSHYKDRKELREFIGELSAKGVPVNLLP